MMHAGCYARGSVLTLCLLGLIGSCGSNPVLALHAPISSGARVLYRADWSAGLADWKVQPGYSVANGILRYDGSGSGDALAPFTTAGVENFAVVATIAVVSYTDMGTHSFGPFVRYTATDPNRGIYPGTDFLHGTTNVAALFWRGNADNYVPGAAFDPGTDYHSYRAEVRGSRYRLLIDGRDVVPWTIIKEDHALQGVGVTSNLAQISIKSFEVIALSPKRVKRARDTRPLEMRALTPQDVGLPKGQGEFEGNGAYGQANGLDLTTVRKHGRIWGYTERFDSSITTVIEDLEEYKRASGAQWAYAVAVSADQQQGDTAVTADSGAVGEVRAVFTAAPAVGGQGSGEVLVEFRRGSYAVRLTVRSASPTIVADAIALAGKADTRLQEPAAAI